MSDAGAIKPAMAQQPNEPLVRQSALFYQRINTIYKPLQSAITQIRLMHVEPGQFEELNIKVTLSIVDLDNLPEYDALSYTWGSLDQTVKISLHETPFEVTTNQYMALRRLRLPDRPRTIWVDATCINQADIAERSSQVSIIGRVYAGATRTRVWLGEPQLSWSQVTEAMWEDRMKTYRSEPGLSEYMAKCVRSRPESIAHRFDEVVNQRPDGILEGALCVLELMADHTPLKHFPFCDLDRRGWFVRTGKLVHNRVFYEVLNMVLSLLTQPWWTRVWIVQETCMSKSVPVAHIGSREIPVDLFYKAGKGFKSTWQQWQRDDYLLRFVFDLDTLIDGFRRSSSCFFTIEEYGDRIGSLSVPLALGIMRGRGATDRRDFIYATLSLIREDHRLPPDYNLNVSEVFALASWNCYTSYLEGFNLLNEASGINSNDIPSWAVDWSSLSKHHFDHVTMFTAEEDRNKDLEQCYFTAGLLQMSANKLETIDTVLERRRGHPISQADPAIDTISWMRQLTTLGYFSENNLVADDSNAAANFFITIFREARTDETGEMKLFSHEEDWKGFIKWYSDLKHVIEHGDALAIYNATSTQLAKDLDQSLEGSDLCITKEGRLCLVKESVQPGDCLYHLKGCAVPFALRSLGPQQWIDDDDEEHTVETFQIVGSCYARGLMGTDGVDPTTDQIVYLV